MTCVSRTALSTGRAETFGDDGGDLVLGQITGAAAGSVDECAKLVIRELTERFVEVLEPSPRHQEYRENLMSELLTLGLGKALDLRDE